MASFHSASETKHTANTPDSKPRIQLRILFITAGLILLSIVIYWLFSSQDAAPAKKPAISHSMVIETIRISPSLIRPTYTIQGQVKPSHQVQLTAEVSGRLTLSSFEFKEGQSFSKGAALVHIDDRQALLKTAEMKIAFMQSLGNLIADYTVDHPKRLAKWMDFLTAFHVDRPLPELPKPISHEEQFYLASKGILGQYYAIQSQEVQLSKYRIHAPFDGTVVEGALSPGQTVQPGLHLGTLMETGTFDIRLYVPVSMLKWIHIGQSVTVVSDPLSVNETATVFSINDRVDPPTQTCLVLARVSSATLKSDSYVTATFSLTGIPDAVQIPRVLVTDRHVLAVQNDVITKIPVEIVYEIDDTVIVTGIPGDTVIAATSVDRLKPGDAVRTTPSASLQ